MDTSLDKKITQRPFYQILMPLAFSLNTNRRYGCFLRPVVYIGIFNWISMGVFSTGYIVWTEFHTLPTPVVLELFEYMIGGLLYALILIVFLLKKQDVASTFNCIQTTFVEWSIKRGMDPNTTYIKNIKIVKILLTVYAVIGSLISFSPLFSAISNIGESPLDTRSHWIMYWPKVFRIQKLSVYLFIYLIQLVSAFFLFISTGSSNLGLMVFLSESKSQFEYLLHGLKEAFMYRHEEVFRDKFIDCIRHHQSIIKFLDYYKSYFKWVVLIENILLQGLFAIGIYTLIKVDAEFYYKIKVLGTVLFTLTIFCFHCYLGEIVLGMHKRLAENLYDMSWYDMPNKHKKLIVIMFQRTQKDLKLNSAIFTNETASKTFITNVIKQVYTLLNVLLKT